MNDNYYKTKHRIDFYLSENGITDLSDYRLGHPATTSIIESLDRAATDKIINIEH